MCVAALDLCPAKMKLVNTCIKELAEQFPSSLRVSMLEGLKYEYLKKWDDALEMLVKQDDLSLYSFNF